LGNVNEYRKFIPNLAEIALPLYEMTKKNGVLKQDQVKIAVSKLVDVH